MAANMAAVAEDIFKHIFLIKNTFLLIQISLKFFAITPIDNNRA